MQTFTEFTEKNPEDLLTEAEDEIKAGILMWQRNIKKYLIGFRKHLQDAGLAPHTVKDYMIGVKNFYRLLTAINQGEIIIRFLFYS